MAYTITDATPERADILTNIAMQSKGVWGYDEAFMQAARQELMVTPQRLSSPHFINRCLVENEKQVQGFYSLSLQPDGQELASYKMESRYLSNLKKWFNSQTVIELEALFILPTSMGKGYGQALFKHAISSQEIKPFSTLLIQSDPNALSFYQKLGCQLIGEKESGSIKGRFLPLLMWDLV